MLATKKYSNNKELIFKTMIVNFIVNLCQFKESILFLHIRSSSLLKYATQNNQLLISFYIIYHFWF